jgi:hypothetical protein
MRKRPALTSEIAEVANFDARLFSDLAHHRLLDGLAGLNEPGQRAVTTGREVQTPTHQHLPAARNHHHHRGCDPRVGGQAA